MSGAWLEELLPRSILSPRTKILWVLFFAIFPLAYIGGVMLEMAEENPARVAGALDRAASSRKAQEFAESKGFGVAGWRHYVIVETNASLLAYYGDGKQADLAAASSLAPAREVLVLFRSSDQRQEFRAYLSLTGQVTGFDAGKGSSAMDANFAIGAVQVHSTSSESSNEAARTPNNREAETIARRFLATNAALNQMLTLGGAKLSANEDDALRTDVAWDTRIAGRQELTFHVVVSVRDSQVIAQRIEGSLDGDYAKSHLPGKLKFPIVLDSIYGLFLTFGVVYAIYRYAKRTLQKEVSHLRTLVVAGLFCISYSVYVYSLAVDQLATRVSAERFATIMLAASVTAGLIFAVMGLLVGIAYGSGEGEVREAYPGKLTSLDALLAGRIFSQDIAASILFGAAAAGWLLLCQHSLSHFLQTDILGARNDGLRYTFARLPWLTLLLGRQYESLLIAVAGLLLPASFLWRTSVRKKRRFVWLILFALASVFHEAAHYPTVASSLLAMVTFVSALLLPFFAFDLLAAMVSLSALAFVNELAQLSVVFPSWTGFALWLAVLAVATLAIATYLALRGKRVREEDVRPQYAKNLAERMGMQAEMLAAREAQLRLLPQSAPEIPGLQFAACCLPAREVGGDFYDFFRLDAHRVGIFMAQGGERGLASALCIALAKGVLMHASQQLHSSVQIVMELETSMVELLEGGIGSGIGFAYGVVDTRRNLLNYARVGTSPRLLVHHEGSGLTPSAQLERLAIMPGRSQSAPEIHEGAIHLQAGEHLIFFTDGVTSLRPRRFGRREYQWLDILMRELGRKGEPLQNSLVSALAKYQSQAREDLTAVVLRLEASQAVAQEEVA